jgi:hypothetical protein
MSTPRFVSDPGTDPKASKAVAFGYREGIVRFLPGTLLSQILLWAKQNPTGSIATCHAHWEVEYGPLPLSAYKTDLCCMASATCRKACLMFGGRNSGATEHFACCDPYRSSITFGRARRTWRLLADPGKATEEIAHEAQLLAGRAAKAGLQPVMRINGLSDLPGLADKVASLVDDSIRFVDYSKIQNPNLFRRENRVFRSFSVSENKGSSQFAEAVLASGGSVAAVFHGEWVPGSTWHGYPTIDGDKHDLRFLDPPGTVAWLSAKGPAKSLPAGPGNFVQIPD